VGKVPTDFGRDLQREGGNDSSTNTISAISAGFCGATSSQLARDRAPRCMPGALQQMWRGLLRRRIGGAWTRAANGICSRDCDKGSIDDKHPVLRSFPPQQAILAREAPPDVEVADFSHTENEKWIHEKKYQIGLVSFAAGFSWKRRL
jgi:hypothetical protein